MLTWMKGEIGGCQITEAMVGALFLRTLTPILYRISATQKERIHNLGRTKTTILVEVYFISRSCNAHAHFSAKFAIKFPDHVLWLKNFPSELLLLLSKLN